MDTMSMIALLVNAVQEHTIATDKVVAELRGEIASLKQQVARPRIARTVDELRPNRTLLPGAHAV